MGTDSRLEPGGSRWNEREREIKNQPTREIRTFFTKPTRSVENRVRYRWITSRERRRDEPKVEGTTRHPGGRTETVMTFLFSARMPKLSHLKYTRVRVDGRRITSKTAANRSGYFRNASTRETISYVGSFGTIEIHWTASNNIVL